MARLVVFSGFSAVSLGNEEELRMCLQKFVDKTGGGVEAYSLPLATGGYSQGDCQVVLPGAVAADNGRSYSCPFTQLSTSPTSAVAYL